MDDRSDFVMTVMEDCIEILIDLSIQSQSSHQQQLFTGGYDNTIFMGGEELPLKYTCIICTMIQREPTIVSCCGQHFCKTCLQRCFPPRCPHCQNEELQHFTNKQQLREIQSLQVKCQNGGRGCLWTGELREMEKHMQHDCRKHGSIKTGEDASTFERPVQS